MPIIRYTEEGKTTEAYLNIFPDQFVSEKDKQNESWIKNTMDYFCNKAYSTYKKNVDEIVPNYKLIKGILTPEDFAMQDEEPRSFVDTVLSTVELPKRVKNYSIMTTPLNELVGELSKRPDSYKAKAFDDDSKSAELEHKTKILQDFVINGAKQKIIADMQANGEDPSSLEPEKLQEMSFEQVKDELDSYTSIAEKWANKILECQKVDFNMKEKAEEAFRDLLISNKPAFLIYEDNSKLGFNIEVINPKNVWTLTTPDKKYTSDTTGRNQGAYAGGTVQVMEISEIIELIPDITKEEIDHLKSCLQDYGILNVTKSNLGNPNASTGQDSIIYDTYDPLVLETRMMLEAQMKENDDNLRDFLGLSNNVSAFGYKYVVVRSYWISKKKIGRLTYMDELGVEQTTIVDEEYKKGTIPTEISLEWGWINQWYQGVKIGPDVYHVKPFDLLPYCPLISLNHEIKNTETRSLVDLMKSFQMIYNICINQLYNLLNKEMGRVQLMSLRHIPIPKDADAQDALAMWEMEAREKGVIFVDDSPENLKAPSGFNQFTAIDLTRTQEIQSRYNLAQQMKVECWELIGMSKQRMGSISASETATGTNAAMQQSYSQTEPLFIAFEYLLGQVYQAIIDASLYVESKKPTSTISFINSEGSNSFISVTAEDIKFRDLKVFLTNRPEDTKMFNELRQLSQAIIQNGGSIYDVIELYSTKSIREMKKVFKDLHDQQIQNQQAQQQQQQYQLEIQQQQIEQTATLERERIENDNLQKELDRINKKEVAVINALARNENATADNDNSGVADALEISKLSNETMKAQKDHELKIQEIQTKNKQANDKLQIEKEKLKVARENMINDLAIAKTNAKNRASKNKK